jgi:hypothetical protein
MEYLKNKNSFWRHLLVAPIIWSVIIPLVIVDIWTEIYHRICFPLCRIPYVKRSDYINFDDRTRLKYLTGLQKISCLYCAYANGLVAYIREIAAQTEKYWCGIMHKKDNLEHHKRLEFAKYNDKKDFEKKYIKD